MKMSEFPACLVISEDKKKNKRIYANNKQNNSVYRNGEEEEEVLFPSQEISSRDGCLVYREVASFHETSLNFPVIGRKLRETLSAVLPSTS